MLLVFAAVIGVLVSLASWGYLELIHYLQQWLYKDLPSGLDLSPVPTWWPLPVLAVASVPIAFAMARLPGKRRPQTRRRAQGRTSHAAASNFPAFCSPRSPRSASVWSSVPRLH